ncbi:cytochrome P450 [Mycena leptocephala]|nr:cytochrome P450 [Mycena leptocephala]
MSPPPGIRVVYLFGQLPNLVGPPLAVYCAKLGAELCADCVRAIPDYIIRREAAAHGAIVCPTVPGSTGGIDLLRANTRDLYPREPLAILARDLGLTSSTRLLFQPRILTANPEVFKTILSQEAKNFEKGAEFRQIIFPLLGTSLFNADGDIFHGKMTRPFFHREHISDCDTFDQHAAKAMAQLKTHLLSGHPVDIADIILRFTLDNTTSFIFNHDLHCLDTGLRYPHYVSDTAARAVGVHLSNAFAEAFHAVQTASMDPWARAQVPGPDSAGGAGGEEKKNEMRNREVQGGDPAGRSDHSILRDEIMNITAADRRLDHFCIVRTRRTSQRHGETPEQDPARCGPHAPSDIYDFRELKYLRPVLNETLRLYPFVTAIHPTVLRMNNGPPIYVPIGGKILVSQFVTHRRTDLWVPDELEFDSERFLDERLYKYPVVPNQCIFMPFNADEFPSNINISLLPLMINLR